MDGTGAGRGCVRRHASAFARWAMADRCGARLSALALALALASATGCAPRREPIVLRPIAGAPGLANRPTFRVRVVRLVHRIRPDAPVEDVWRLLGTTDVPYEKRGLWAANDLRLGDGARLAAERMNELVVQTSDRTVQIVELLVRENMDFRITLGPERENLEVLWTDAAGHISGRRFSGAQPGLRLVCRRDASDPATVCIAFVPAVTYGAEALHWVQTASGPVQRAGRQEFTATDLAAEVGVAPGRMLVLGAERRSPVSLGGAFFYEQRGPDLWAQTIVLMAEEVPRVKVPPGTTIPFLPPAPRP
ncbi:MAG TPA: hypothetical protein VFH53_01515 [Phycisphaerae bacterium]|nr:hypothetical protein [Phycisphaerae bacterium]